jgi:ribosomal protein L24
VPAVDTQLKYASVWLSTAPGGTPAAVQLGAVKSYGEGVQPQEYTLIKTRLQVAGSRYTSIGHAARTILKEEGPIHASNVSPVVDGKPTRVRFVTKPDGSKSRIAARNGKELHQLRGPRKTKK